MANAGLADGTLHPFYSNDQDSDNGCGQAAVATLVRHYGVGPYAGVDDDCLVARIWNDHKPDTPWQKLGSTPGHVRNICRFAGFEADWYSSNDREREHAFRALATVVEAGYPVIVLVDMGKLGGSMGQHHYAVWYGFDDDHVHVTNLFDGYPGVHNGEQCIDNHTFLEAWHCWLLNLPGFQYAAITAAPLDQAGKQTAPGVTPMDVAPYTLDEAKDVLATADKRAQG